MSGPAREEEVRTTKRGPLFVVPRKLAALAVALTVLLAVWVIWDEEAIDPDMPKAQQAVAQSGAAGSGTDAGKGGPSSEAERITRLERSINLDRKEIESLRKEMADPSGEYAQADALFQRLDVRWAEHQKKVQGLPAEATPEQRAALDKEGEVLREKWELCKKRFELALQEHRTQQQLLVTLEGKLNEEEQVLARLKGKPVGPGPKAGGAPDRGGAIQGGVASVPEEKKSPAEPPAAGEKEKSAPAPVAAATDARKGEGGEEKPAEKEAERPDKQESRQLAQAREQARLKEEEARAARDRAQQLDRRLESLQASIRLDEQLHENARRKAEQAQQAADLFQKELLAKVAQGADEIEVQTFLERVNNIQERAQQERQQQAEIAGRLRERQSDLQGLLNEQIAAAREAEDKRNEAEAARRKVELLQHPLHPQNLRRWLLWHGPTLLAIVVGMLALRWLAGKFSRRVIKVMTHQGGGKRGTPEDRENRAQTLVSVFQNMATLLIFGGGLLMLMEEIGIPVVPLMGGAAVLGLAVAFGAQNLIRDYFSGFMVLMEDQYSVNDVVKINGTSGLVEHITLRMTVLRDLEGVVHFVPHGIITTVSNLTHGWSRALFQIDVAYKEDVDRVMELLLGLAREMRHDPLYSALILEDPEMLGVDALGDSGVTIKLFMKTRPLKQWLVKRELLRRIKNRFDQLGIEIPFPHRTVYHRRDTDGAVDAERRVA